MLYIVGCGRSGTKYTSTILNQLGIQVLHEAPGPDGEVGWKGLLKILDGELDPAGHVVLHQVRNPLETISSMRTHSHGLLKSVSRHFPTHSSLDTTDGKLHRCMEFWHHWNLLAERYSQRTFQTERFLDSVDDIFEMLKRPRYQAELPAIDPKLNSRRTKRFARFQEEPISWSKLSNIDENLTERIRQQAKDYGYDDSYLGDSFSIAPVSPDEKQTISLVSPAELVTEDRQEKQKIFIAPYLLEMSQVRTISQDICDAEEFFPSTNTPCEEPSWTVAWGYPPTKRRFGIAETGFFWDGMHIDTQGLYQHSSLNSAAGVEAIVNFSTPEAARELIQRAPLPNSKYRQPVDETEWKGVVFACQNPSDRSIHSVASTGDWWRFLEACCRYYGSKLFVKLHPWNNNEIEARIREVGATHGCRVGKTGHGILDHCEHAVLFNSTFSVDCMLKQVPVKQGAPGYFSGTGAVSNCQFDPRKPLTNTEVRAEQLLNFLVWRYCFSMDCSLEDWKERLRQFASSTDLFPLSIDQSYGAYLQNKAGLNPDVAQIPTPSHASLGSDADQLLIPKVFHIIWMGDKKIPDDHRAWIQQWQALHPDWETRIWGNEVANELSDELRELFEQANSWSGKSDIARVAIVHKYGGVYRDTDYRPLRRINPILQGCRAFAMVERPNGRLTGSLFGAVPDHPFLGDIIKTLPSRFDPHKPMKAGPLLFDEVFKKGRGDVRLFEREVFSPVTSSKKQQARTGHFPHSFAVHTYAGSWTNPPKVNRYPRNAGLINEIIRRFGYQSYLEIGCETNRTFNRIRLTDKTGVDPASGGTHRMTSDDYFAENQRSFDLIFVDGLHLEEQVLRDVDHSLNRLNRGGLILIHDCLPRKEAHQLRTWNSGPWTGDVWKAVVQLRQRSDVDIAVLNGLWGMGALKVRPNSQLLSSTPSLTWDDFQLQKKELLRILDWPEYWRFLEGS